MGLSLFGNVVEYTPRVALQLFQMKPFPDVATFLSSLEAAVDSLSLEEKTSVLSGHPDLAGRLADSNLLTPESAMEQREAGLDSLTAQEKERLRRHNEQYRDKFGL